MIEPTYIADLTEGDYPRFREKDPALPATFREWAVATAERVRRRRQTGENLIRHLIRFDAFVERNSLLRIPSFDEATRDDYADEQAAAERL